MIDLSKYKKLIPLKECSIYELASIMEGHKEELLTEVERLQKLVESMKCCGNCDHYNETGMGVYSCILRCKESRHIFFPVHSHVCDKWEIAE